MSRSLPRSRRRGLPVVIVLAAGSALACGWGGDGVELDTATGCCRYDCGNGAGCGYELGACPETEEFAGSVCDTAPADTAPTDTDAAAP